MISDEIRAKVDEAKRRLDVASIAPWVSVHTHPVGQIGRIETTIPDEFDDIVTVANGIWTRDADLIVSVVNRERAQIEHARDVMERHRPNRSADPRYWAPGTPKCFTCCSEASCDESADWPCADLLSLGRAWGVDTEDRA